MISSRFCAIGRPISRRKERSVTRGFFKASPNDCEAWKEFAREKLFADCWYAMDRPTNVSIVLPTDDKAVLILQACPHALLIFIQTLESSVSWSCAYISLNNPSLRNSLIISPWNSIISFVSNSYLKLHAWLELSEQESFVKSSTLLAKTRRVYIFARSAGVHRARRGRISRR